jgi:Recombination directionality factor-like
MADRIITLQRQMRELGRLRCGYSEMKPTRSGENKPQPVKSATWILTSRHRHYLEAAVELGWGRDIENWTPQGQRTSQWRLTTDMPSIDALLPPGDPISQHYEMWSGGGCTRRCNGEREQTTNQACVCREEYGDEFYRRSAREVCKTYTRLGVILPQLPDVGQWQIVTKGYHSAVELPAQVDLIRYATGGTLAVPIALGIEQRSELDEGKRRDYQVVILQVRGAVMGPMLTAAAERAAIEAGGQPARQAIEQAPRSQNGHAPGPVEQSRQQVILELHQLITDAKTIDDLNDVRRLCVQAEIRDAPLLTRWRERGKQIQMAQQAQAGSAAHVPDQCEPAEIVPPKPARTQLAGGVFAEDMPIEVVQPSASDNRAALWMQVLGVAGGLGWDNNRLNQEFSNTYGHGPKEATAQEMTQFLDRLHLAAARD